MIKLDCATAYAIHHSAMCVGVLPTRPPIALGVLAGYKTGPNIAIVLFQSRRVVGQCATLSAVTGRDWAK